MCKLFSGSCGLIIGMILLTVSWCGFYRVNKAEGNSYEFDPDGEKGAFEKFHGIYLDIMKFVLGLSSGSIVLLVGSAALRKSERLPESFASPLFLLCLSILYGILFMVFLTTDYESYRHKKFDYTSSRYSRNVALGYSSLLCFLIGYAWLIYIVTHTG